MKLEKGTIPGSVIINGNDIAVYVSLRNQGYVTVWCGEGRICMCPPKPEDKTIPALLQVTPL